MALNSPGVQVTIIDESNYTPAATGTVPFLVVATAQDKTNTSGDVAEYTTAANAGKVFLVTSQRELINKYGKPNFLVANGTPVHGYELNEYGLMAAYSALGVSNAAYIMRADVDLAELASSLVRPTGGVANNTLWLDTDVTRFGIFEWNSSLGFIPVLPTNAMGSSKLHVITDTDLIVANEPSPTIGVPGDYAIDATDINNPVFYKAAAPSPIAGQWAQVGTADWHNSWPAVLSTNANPTLTLSHVININGSNISVGGTTVSVLAGNINSAAISGVTAAVTNDGRLALYNTSGTNLTVADITGNTFSSILGIDTSKQYAKPEFQASAHTDVPQWRSTDATPRPTGSVWFKTTSPNAGANFVVKRYNAASETWVELTTPVYSSDAAAIYALDQTGGGINIPAGRTYVESDVTDSDEFTFKLFERQAGVTRVTGNVANPVFAGGGNITIKRTIPGNATLQPGVTVSFTGNTAANLISAINNAGISYVSAAQETNGKITITHSAGGVMEMYTNSGNVLNLAGITISTTGARESDINPGNVWVSNWAEADYTVSSNTPSADPADGTYWYYNNPTEFDIMINDGTKWKGYGNVSVDSRGFDLTATSPAGPLVSASEPLTQSDGSALVNGDLWINTANLEDFPKIYRYENSEWVLLDVTDQTTENGVVFADARWGNGGSIDAITDEIPTIESLRTSDYVDPDCPSYALYPRGILLFNTRRSGMNVKQFVVNHFADADPAPVYKNAWVSASGNDSNGTAYLGRRAQRALITAKMAAAVSNSVEAVEEVRNFNIIAAPGYPELASTLVQLNVNRKETAFVVSDTPFRLEADSNELLNYSNSLETRDDNLVNYEYLAAYYPSGYTRDLDGNFAVVPPTHMALRTIIRSDQRSYPWFAPAGIRRGTVDNATAIGYIDAQSGEFQSIGVSNPLRDVLYQGKINPITVLTGSGIVVYGQKTRSAIVSALDRVNVARLVVYLRRQLDLIARQYIFEPNDEITRKEIKNQIEKELNSIQSNRGIYDYAVVCDSTNNTPDRIDRNELWVDVAIEPVKAVEFIYIPVRIKNTGDIEAGL